jgi:L-ascorbate metabolism protein UlaG (beta-lactamase superfamily)
VNINSIGRAGFAVHAVGCTIIMDPWLSGTKFNGGFFASHRFGLSPQPPFGLLT